MRIVFAGLLFFGLLALLPSVAPASDARLDGLAVQREYVEDYYNFRIFPTVVARYKNLVTASLGSRDGGDRSVGVIGAGENTSYGAFAIYLNQQDRIYVTDEVGGTTAAESAELDLAWAKQFSGLALGLAMNWVDSSLETGEFRRSPANWNNQGANLFSVIGGAKFDVGDKSTLELAAELAQYSWEAKNAGGTVISTDAGNLTYRFVGRMMSEMGEKTTLVPLLSYGRVDLTAEEDADVTRSDRLNIGVAAHHEVNGDDLLIMGVAANYLKRTTYTTGAAQSAEFSRWDMPALFVALEFDMYSWLTARVGATKTIDFSTVDSGYEDAETTDAVSSRYFFGLGMGLHFDHFDVDATMNPDALFTGGYLFSGESSRPITRITGTYFF
jgi:hypothetical protein